MNETGFVLLPVVPAGMMAGSQSPAPMSGASETTAAGGGSPFNTLLNHLLSKEGAETPLAPQNSGANQAMPQEATALATLKGIEDLPPEWLFAEGCQGVGGQCQGHAPPESTDATHLELEGAFELDERGRLLVSAQLLSTILARLNTTHGGQNPANQTDTVTADAQTLSAMTALTDPTDVTPTPVESLIAELPAADLSAADLSVAELPTSESPEGEIPALSPSSSVETTASPQPAMVSEQVTEVENTSQSSDTQADGQPVTDTPQSSRVAPAQAAQLPELISVPQTRIQVGNSQTNIGADAMKGNGEPTDHEPSAPRLPQVGLTAIEAASTGSTSPALQAGATMPAETPETGAPAAIPSETLDQSVLPHISSESEPGIATPTQSESTPPSLVSETVTPKATQTNPQESTPVVTTAAGEFVALELPENVTPISGKPLQTDRDIAGETPLKPSIATIPAAAAETTSSGPTVKLEPQAPTTAQEPTHQPETNLSGQTPGADAPKVSAQQAAETAPSVDSPRPPESGVRPAQEVYLRVPANALPEQMRGQGAELVLHVSKASTEAAEQEPTKIQIAQAQTQTVQTQAAQAQTAQTQPLQSQATPTQSTQVVVDGETLNVQVLDGSKMGSQTGDGEPSDGQPKQQTLDLKQFVEGDEQPLKLEKAKDVEATQAERELIIESERNKRGLTPQAVENPRPERPSTDTEAKSAQTHDAQRPSVTQADRGTQQTQSTTNTSSTSMKESIERYEQISRQLVRGVSSQFGDGRSHVTIRLVPESLGQVDIRLVVENGVLSARMWAKSEDTRTLLERHANQLRATLEEGGVRVDRVTVAREAPSRDGYSREQSDHNRQSGQGRRQGDGGAGSGKQDNPDARRNPKETAYSFEDYNNPENLT